MRVRARADLVGAEVTVVHKPTPVHVCEGLSGQRTMGWWAPTFEGSLICEPGTVRRCSCGRTWVAGEAPGLVPAVWRREGAHRALVARAANQGFEVIPVVWLSYHQGVPHRGYWDQSMVEALTHGELGRTANTFEHFDGWPQAVLDGAVVVLPARYHVDDADRLNDDLARLQWCVLFLTSDEESLFPWRKIHHPNLRLWIMTPRPGVHDPHDARFIGEGWSPEVRAALQKLPFPEKQLDWAFAGQVTHGQRLQLAEHLRRLPNGRLVETAGFTQGLDRAGYAALLADAKVAPAPSGPATPDSFRLYEALEAGCLPIVHERCPGYDDEDYWDLLLGDDPLLDGPFAVTDTWSGVGLMIDPLVSTGWPANANRTQARWMAYKRRLQVALDADLAAVGVPCPSPAVDDRITVLVTMSPIASHPATAVIDETLASIRERLPRAEIIVLCDGVRPEQEDRRDDYEQAIRRLLWTCNLHGRNVLPVIFDDHVHQANMVRAGLEHVRTPLVLFVEHDTPLVGEIPWDGLCDVVQSGDAHVVRFHHEASVLAVHEHLCPDSAARDVRGVPLRRTVQWSSRPHLADTEFYRQLIGGYFGVESRTFTEDVLHGVVDQAWREHGEDGWDEFRLWIYSPPGDIKRSTHLDGRAGEAKFDDRLVFAYDGPTPRGAPAPTAERDD